MIYKLPIWGVLAACMLFTGCATTAPKYNTNFDNVAKLRAADLAPAKIAVMTKESGAKSDVDSLTIRGGSYKSPYGSYTAYVREALKQEFNDARLDDPNSTVEVGGVLLRNVLDASGFSRAFAEIEARIQVKRDQKIVYNSIKTARVEWDSSFVGAVAIPRAAQSYPSVIQKLLGELYADPQFLAALKK
jgi:hypothetical protein